MMDCNVLGGVELEFLWIFPVNKKELVLLKVLPMI